MLLNQFYTLDACDYLQGTPQFKARITLLPDHPVYKGHFPEIPIAPGVCLTQVIKEILSAQLQKPLVMVAADNIKFLVLIDPRQHSSFELNFQLSEDNHGLSASCSYVNGTTTFLKFKGKFRFATAL
jgi:3-hydroxyacyl-[acyl-carrier-protein] dehydratase